MSWPSTGKVEEHPAVRFLCTLSFHGAVRTASLRAVVSSSRGMDRQALAQGGKALWLQLPLSAEGLASLLGSLYGMPARG